MGTLTHAQRAAREALGMYGSQRKAARALGISRGALLSRLANADIAESNGVIYAQSVLKKYEYEDSGDTILCWSKIHPEARDLTNFADALVEKAKGQGKVPRRRERKTDTEDMLLEVAINDPHIGMYAWGEETGAKNYDTNRGVNLVLDAVSELTSRARPAETLLVFNGDILHCDNRANITEKSGNPLDVDGRYPKVVDAAVEALVGSVQLCAETAGKVNVLVVPGNHDYHSAVILARVLQAYFHSCPNINVIINNRPRHVFQWGSCLIGHAHGDRVRPAEWSKIIPTEFAQMWADTKYRYMHLGHIHKNKSFSPVEIDEQIGLVVEYLKALCPPDAWHVESGYVGTIRGADGFLYHKDLGLDTRWSFNAI